MVKGHAEWIRDDQCGGGVTSVAFSCDSNRIISGSRDGTIRVWKVSTQHNPHPDCLFRRDGDIYPDRPSRGGDNGRLLA